MIILHAGLEDGQILLWGESPAPALSPSAPRGRKPKVPRPRPFPFDPGADPLAAAVADSLPGTTRRSLHAEERFLWLPTVERPSRAVQRPRRRAAGAGRDGGPGAVERRRPAPRPGAGHRPALRLRRPGDAGPRRRSSAPRSPSGPGPCASPAPWSPANSSSPTCGRRGGRGKRAGGRCSRGPTRSARARLARAMPPACRALSADGAAPPQQPAAGLLDAFLDTMVDALVRLAAAGRPARPSPPGAAARPPRPSPACTTSGCTPCAAPTAS